MLCHLCALQSLAEAPLRPFLNLSLASTVLALLTDKIVLFHVPQATVTQWVCSGTAFPVLRNG